MESYKVASILYLHGLASSPNSRKATAIGEYSSREQIPFVSPDLSVPTFETLSIGTQLQVISENAKLLPNRSALIGSSFGGFLALNALNKIDGLLGAVSKLVLIAPVLDWRRSKVMSPQLLQRWRTKGSIPKFHSGSNSERELPWSFFEELSTYPEATLPPTIHCLLIHGFEDEELEFNDSKLFAERYKGQIEFVGLPGGHELMPSISEMVSHIDRFLKAPLPPNI